MVFQTFHRSNDLAVPELTVAIFSGVPALRLRKDRSWGAAALFSASNWMMKQLLHEELTLADIRALAASIYEPEPRIWRNGRWKCPQCLVWNQESNLQCACGISRDGLAEFCERDSSQ